MEKLALRHQLKNQSECNRRWLLGTSRQMMDDFLLKWQLCCVSAILIQHKCTGRLSWLFNSYHCGKWISNLWRAISGWQGTYGLFFSFSFPSLFFFPFPFCKPEERFSLKFPRHLPQAAREQRAELCSPCSSGGSPPGRAEQGGQSLPAASTTAPVLRYPENLKRYLFIKINNELHTLQVCNALFICFGGKRTSKLSLS